ncbi:RmlC-like cupin [Trametes versicolor FP-101664 SS1]|uniref:RmlC-like cupin n=1 Tax=Trametes versicolor (strain FP-101664) TaxID=717944 RepID=UPI0004624890|nr:RmlC-like cupin [Trametes versicolor FP-101664 SS1]EIW61982.1 RmlC-like cupin [Trametes versicolor FP-101664 SS1]
MISTFYLSLALAAGALAQSSVSPIAQKITALRDAPTQVDRIKLLDKDSDFTFNFLNATATKGAGGAAVGATVANFPALVNNAMAMTIGFLGPCGMNTPHTHPRATEMLYVVNGTLSSGMIAENGARFVFNTLEAGSAMLFPKGSIHFQQNEGCEPMMFVAALNHEDPGVESIAQRYFGLPPDVVAASLGDIGVQEVAGIEDMIPDNIALGTQECLDRCGIKRDGQPTTQRQPRNANNALPGQSSGDWAATSTTAASWQTTGSAYATSTSTHYSRDTQQTGALFGAVAEDAQTVVSKGVSNGVLIALIAVVGVMGLGYCAIAVVYFVSRRRAAKEKAANRWYVRPEMAGRTLVPTTEERGEEKYDVPA